MKVENLLGVTFQMKTGLGSQGLQPMMMMMTNSAAVAEKVDKHQGNLSEALLEGACIEDEKLKERQWDEILQLADMCDPEDLQAEWHTERKETYKSEPDWNTVQKWRQAELDKFAEVGVYRNATTQEMQSTLGGS